MTIANNPKALALFETAYETLLSGMSELGFNITDANFDGTAKRAAKGFHALVLDQSQTSVAIDEMLATCFPAKFRDMVVSKHNVAFGLCPHHLLPVIYNISVAYLPQQRVIGLSKISRLVRMLARAPVLQEDLTEDLANLFHTRLASDGSAVFVEGMHLCMAARGVGAHEARLSTTAVRGKLAEPALRQEFMKLATTVP